MRLGIFAKTFPGSEPGPVLAAVAAAGFTAAQYNMTCSGLPPMPDEVPDAVVLAIKSAVKTSGVKIAALSGTFNMIHPDVAVRAQGLERLENLAIMASAFPTKLITLCTGTRDTADIWRAHPGNRQPDAYSDLLKSMERAIEIAERHEIHLGIEPEFANVVSSAAVARRLIDDLKSPRVKVVLDPANLVERETVEEQREIVRHAIDLLADRIALAHAKDRNAAGEVVPAGQGTIDFPHFFRLLKTAGFDGQVVTHGLAAADATGVAKFLHRTLGDAGIAVSR